MKSPLTILIVLTMSFFSTILYAQQDTVPGVAIANTKFEKIIIVRLKYKTDMLEGIKKAVEMEHIKNAVIITGIGSVTAYSIHAVNSDTFPTKNIFLKEKSPCDVLNLSGYIFDGKVHAHITLSDTKKTIGGHLEPGTLVYTYAIITIGILSDDAKLENFDNKEWR